MLRRWGDGASLIRGPWKARDDIRNDEDEDAMDMEEIENDEDNGNSKPLASENANGTSSVVANGESKVNEPIRAAPKPNGVDSMTNSFDALSLVPSNIRFGRGGKRGGLIRQVQPSKPSVPITSEKAKLTDVNVEVTEGPQYVIDICTLGVFGNSSLYHDRPSRNSVHVQSDLQPTTELRTASFDAKDDTNEEVCINIDAALEALKSEIRPTTTTTPHTNNERPRRGLLRVTDTNRTPVFRGRGFGVRGAAIRGRGRGWNRGRGMPSNGRT